MHNAIFSELKRLTLLEDLDDATLRNLASGSRFIGVNRQTPIFLAGDVATELYFVAAGCVKRSLLSLSGQERVITILTPGQMFGEAEVFGLHRHTAMATAIEHSTIIGIDYTVLRHCIKHDLTLGLRIIEAMAQRQIEADADTANSLIDSVADRVLDFLVRQAGTASHAGHQHPRDGRSISLFLPVSKKVIASKIGITPETLSRAFRELSAAGLIGVERNEITLNMGKVDARARHSPQGASGPSGWSRESRRHGSWSVRQASREVTLKAVNKAGLQRMLSQRIARSWLMLWRNILPEIASGTLQRSISLFERYLYDLSTLAMRGEAQSALARLHTVWRPYRQFLRAQPEDRHVAELLSLSHQVLLAAQELTTCLENELGTPSAHYVNRAGRQRMLSQRIATLFLCADMMEDSAWTHTEIAEAREEFGTSLQRLTHTIPESAQAIVRELAHVQESWRRIESALDLRAKPNSVDDAKLIVEHSDAILERMDRAIHFYQANAA